MTKSEKQIKEFLKALDTLPEEIEDNKWKKVIGEKAWLEGKERLAKFERKDKEKFREILIAKWEKEHNPNILPLMVSLGLPVDYSPNDYKD